MALKLEYYVLAVVLVLGLFGVFGFLNSFTGMQAAQIQVTPPSTCGNGLCEAKYWDNGDEDNVNCPQDCPQCGNELCDYYYGEDFNICPQDCSICGDGKCFFPEDGVSCPSDCKPVCGDGNCNKPENPTSCPQDCQQLQIVPSVSALVCGDGVCDPREAAPTHPTLAQYACPQDCPVMCGDKVCDSANGESWQTCIEDCPRTTQAQCFGQQCVYCGDGVCEPLNEDVVRCPQDCKPKSYCGDYLCDVNVGENSQNCINDCVCGDNVCDNSEDAITCPLDCKVASPSPIIFQPQQACANSGGVWKQFRNTCADSCNLIYACAQVIVDDCDCGPNNCWDGSNCVSNPPVCGDGTCDFSETYISCPQDCTAKVVPPVSQLVCGDGVCDPREADATNPKLAQYLCSQDCQVICGDQVCDGANGESWQTCVADCPKPSPPSSSFWNWLKGWLRLSPVPVYYCGDGVCNPGIGEDINTCPADCP
ncbi:hypothetical protein HZA97_09865 [Candidatus Woesearchaeota archaeon]|nr:hypothetical protein [Candidatus Woesearchaeota archaeon]